MSIRTYRIAAEAVVACMQSEGFPVELPPPDVIDPEEMLHSYNAQFPYIDALAADGLRIQRVAGDADQGSDDGRWGPRDDAEREAATVCRQDEDVIASGIDIDEGFDALYAAWLGVLDEIEASDEVDRLAEEFSACLLEEGVPIDSTATEIAYLSYVDRLMMHADEAEQQQIAEQYGKLYVECGRELFEARERLRGGERRVEFLAEHADAILELDAYLYGDGASR